jgi:hypothetical protein
LFRAGLALAAVAWGVLELAAGGRHSERVPAGNPERDGQPGDGPSHYHVRYERSDANHRWVIGIVLATLVLAAVIQSVIMRFFQDYQAYQDSIKRSRYSLALPRSERLPPQPRLEQINRMASEQGGDVYSREQRKENVLDRYGTLPGDEKFVRIPIERAIDYLADKQPARPRQPATDQARRQNGLVNDGASNSGRMFRGAAHD